MSLSFRGEDRPGLYCIELRTPQWENAVRWYREVLGLRVLVRVAEDGYALLEAGETRIALLARPTSGPPTRRISLAFEVRDLTLAIERFEESGASLSQVRENSEGLREVNIMDPDGNRIRVFCWPRDR